MDILVFEIGDRLFGFPAAAVVEVVRAVTPVPVPRTPDSIMGVINLRGALIPVINTRSLMQMDSQPVGLGDHLIVIDDDRRIYAIHANHAIDLLSLDVNFSAEDSSDAGILGPPVNTRLGCVQVLNPATLLSADVQKTLASLVSSHSVSEPQ